MKHITGGKKSRVARWIAISAVWIVLSTWLAPMVQGQITVLGKDPRDRFLATFWSTNNTASNLVAGVNAYAGTNRWVNSLMPLRPVVTTTTNYTLLASQTRSLITNEGATNAVQVPLPSASAGLEFVAIVMNTNGLRVVAAAGDYIRVGTGLTTAGGYVESTALGDVLHIFAVNSAVWVAKPTVSSWLLE